MYPHAEFVQRQHWRAGHYLRGLRALAKHCDPQHAVVADQPVNRSRIEAVAHEKGVELPVESLRAHPPRKGQGFELSRDKQAHAVVDILEFQSLFLPPSTFPALTP